TLPHVCYETDGSPRRYSVLCKRKFSWGEALEDYILPTAHTVNIAIAPQHATAGECQWSWRPRAAGGKAETRKLACNQKLTIARVPYSVDRRSSGVAVSVKLPDGREL